MHTSEFTSYRKWSWQEPCKISRVSLCVYLESLSLQSLPEPLLTLSSGSKHKRIQQGHLPTPQFLAYSQTWVFSTIRSQRVTSGGLSPHPIQRVGHLRANPGLGYSSLSLSSWLRLSSTNLLYREDFPSLHMG